MKIAVIGTGISGLAISYILSKNHQLTIYEKNDYIPEYRVSGSV